MPTHTADLRWPASLRSQARVQAYGQCESRERIRWAGGGVHSHPNEQIVWMLKGKMEFRLGTEQQICGQGDVVVVPGGVEHEAWFREDTEVIDFFAPPRDDFLLGGKPAYMRES